MKKINKSAMRSGAVRVSAIMPKKLQPKMQPLMKYPMLSPVTKKAKLIKVKKGKK